MKGNFNVTTSDSESGTVNIRFVNKYTNEPINLYSNVMVSALEKAGKSVKKEFFKRTKDEQRLKKQREKFLGTCKFCKQPMTWVKGSNILVCNNEKCEGLVVKDKDGIVLEKIPYSRLLTGEGSDIAETLLG